MNSISLSRKREKVLPETVTDETGTKYKINADFRNVLRCIRVCTDPNQRPEDVLYMLCVWFFEGIPVPDPIGLFNAFLSTGEQDEDEPPRMDFEQDADAIYSSFLKDYGIDLLEVPYMHWYKFCALLSGLSSETALSGRIQLREMDTSKMTGKEKLKAEKAKRKVQLIERMSAEEEALCAELEKALADGKNPTEALKKLKNR